MLHEVNFITPTTKQMIEECEAISGIASPLALSGMILIMILVLVSVGEIDWTKLTQEFPAGDLCPLMH